MLSYAAVTFELCYSEVIYHWFCRGWSKSGNFDLKWDSNLRPFDWFSDALPVSYLGLKNERRNTNPKVVGSILLQVEVFGLRPPLQNSRTYTKYKLCYFTVHWTKLLIETSESSTLPWNRLSFGIAILTQKELVSPFLSLYSSITKYMA